MSRLLVITQKVDETDDLLGFFVGWLRQFAGHFERVDVIALGAGEYALPDNVHVHSLGKEKGAPRWRRLLGVFPLLWRYTPRHGAVFCHMSPIFALVAWPFARIRRSRLCLWYLHRSRTFRLRMAVALCDVVVTADGASLTVQNQKIVSVGHGIDVQRFTTARDWSALNGRPLRIVSVGRLSPIKDFATLIRAASLARERQVSLEVRIVGKAVMAGDRAYEEDLQRLVQRIGARDIVTFTGFVPYRDIARQYAWADVVVGCTPRGGIDKVLLEAMAAGCVALTSNVVMAPYLAPYDQQLLFAHGDVEDLAAKIQALSDWETVSRAMTASVREHHDLRKTIATISALV